MLANNAQETLAKTLASASCFSEILILDNGSTDQTLEIASSFPNVRIEKTPFIGFGPLRNLAAKLAASDWILAIDSDEILSSALIEELLNLSLDPQYIYEIPRHNFYRGKQIRGCGWHPEWVARLYHRRRTSYCQSQVHESVMSTGCKTIRLKSPLFHTPYRSTEDFLKKMQHYTSLFAKQNSPQKKSSFSKACLHGFFAFFKSYFLKRGIFDGQEGFIISLYNANTAFYKYLKLMEAVQDGKSRGNLRPPQDKS